MRIALCLVATLLFMVLIGCEVQTQGTKETAPDLTVSLSEQNTGIGLTVPSGGDGTNTPDTVQGVPVRRMTGKGAQYLYVRVDHPGYAQGPCDVYVIVEVFDEGFGRMAIQYDKDAPTPNLGSFYTLSPDSFVLTGSGKWREAYFHLPGLRLGHGQNFESDFRLMGYGLAIRRITVTPRKPKGYNPDQVIDPGSLRAIQVRRPAGMELTFGNDASPGDAAVFKALSVTSVESYVDWAGVEPEEGKWDWSKWDKQVATLKAAGVKWVPFLVVGPAYATPKWFHEGPHSHYYRCLEHKRDSKVQSLFNPDWPPYVERFLKAFADRYRGSGVIESVLLGITGIYGESIYPAGPEGGWTARLTGDYHNHAGWWAGDDYAGAAFQAAMKNRYADISALNAAWGTRMTSFAEVTAFLPDQAPSDRARADFVEWYQQAMTDWAVFWVAATRKVFPKTEIYLCTGGNGDPVLGADFTAQTKAIAPYRAGVRITNEGSDYAANFTITREVATATRHYRTFAGFEPAGKVDPKGVIARIYNATASGVLQLHYYKPNVLETNEALQNFRSNAGRLIPRRPRVEAALYIPRETWALDPGSVKRFYDIARPLRDLMDMDYVTRRSVADGVLSGHRLLVLAESAVLAPEAAAAIEAWVSAGGVLVAATRSGETIGSRLYDNATWRGRLLSASANAASLLVPAADGAAPARWVLRVGSEGDDVWLFGDWNGRERGQEWPDVAGSTKRWSGACAGVYLPVRPGGEYALRLSAHLSGYSVGPVGNDVRVNGQAIGRLDKAGSQTYCFRVPAAVIGQESVARLEIRVNTFKPSERGSKDSRTLGVALREVDWAQVGAEKTPPAQAMLCFRLNPARTAPLLRRVGKGWTMSLPGSADDPATLVRCVEALCRDSAAILPGVPPLAFGDGKMDGRFVTLTDQGALTYEAQAATITETAPKETK